jgi:hypothetical protein
MTVYVDDMNLRADVPNGRNVVRGKWSHLYADSEAELREFAAMLGLRPEWIQHPGETGVHFDVTSSVRERAIRQGARPVTWREAGEHMARMRRAERAQEAPRTAEHEQAQNAASRPTEGRARHVWRTTREGTRTCQRGGCGMEAEQHWNPATGRPVVIYSRDGRAVVAGRVPRCGTELPDSGNTPQERQHLADAADRQAGLAYKSGDLDRAFRLVTDARVLDPDRRLTWDFRVGQIREKARPPQQKQQEPETDADDAQIERERREWALWNQSVYQRGQREAGLNAYEGGRFPSR